MPFFTPGIKRFLLYGIAVFVSIIILSPLILTWAVNTAYVKEKTASFLYQKTKIQIDASQFSLAIFPSASLSIHQFVLNPDNHLDIEIDFLKFNIDIQQLFKGKISVKQVIVDGPVIRTARLAPNREKPTEASFASNTVKALKKIFDVLPEHQTTVELKFKNVISDYFKQMDGRLYLSKEKQEIYLNASVKKITLDPGIFSDKGVQKALDIGSIKLEQATVTADLNKDGVLQGNCVFFAPKIFSKNNDLVLDSGIVSLSFELSEKKYKIDMDPFNLNYPKGSVALHFKADQTRKKNEIKFTGSQIHIDQARQMSLTVFKDNAITKSLFSILKAGIAPKVSVLFQSRELNDLFNADHMHLKGNIENGSVWIPKTDLLTTQVNGMAEVKNGLLDIKTTHALIQNSVLEKGDLLIDLLHDTGVPFQGEFSLDVDLSKIPKTLISLLPETDLARELSLVHNVKGQSKAILKLLMKPDSTDLKVDVHAIDFSGTGLYDRIPGPVVIQKANFLYQPDLIDLNHFSADINGSKLKDLKAQISFKQAPQIKIISGSGSIDLESTIPWLMSYKKTRQMISPVKKGSGSVFVSAINLSGPVLTPEAWKVDINGTAEKIQLSTHADQKQIQDLSCRFYFSNEQFTAQKIKGEINQLSWLEPLINKSILDSILVPFNVKKGHLQTGEINSFLTADINFPSGPDVFLSLKGQSPASLVPSTLKIFDNGISNATIVFNHDTAASKFDFSGSLNTHTFNKFIVPGSLWAKKIEESTKGRPILIRSNKDSSLTITAQSIDLNSLLSQPKTTMINKKLLPNNVIHFQADQANIKSLRLDHIDSDLQLKKDPGLIQLNSAFLCGLQTQGHLQLNEQSLSARFFFKAHDNKNIQDLFSCLLGKKEFMDGEYSFSGDLVGKGPYADFLNTLTGTATLNAQNGRIYKLTLLSRILSVLNVSKIFKGSIPDISQNGFAYNWIIVEADIKDSKIYLSRAIIDGQDMTLLFTGWIDPLNDTLDLTCLVSPFKTIDLIIEKIPIVNTILGGRLVSVPAKAMGQLSDPVVVPLHPSAVGKGLVTMMSEILKAPVKLWDKVYSE